jgi:ATP-dependent DNA helicase RecG
LAIVAESTESVSKNSEGKKEGNREGEKRGKKRGEKLSANRQKIVAAMLEDPNVTHVQLTEIVGLGSTNIEKNIQYLKEHGWIRRVGPAKGGHWEVLK